MTKNLPTNFGQKWTNEEDCILLDELSKGDNAEMIATRHNRTIGGIRSRQGVIAYNMHLKNNSMEEIMDKTKLSEECIRQTIFNRENYVRRPDKIKEKKESNKSKDSKKSKKSNEFVDLKKEIAELKNTLYELSEYIKLKKEVTDLQKIIYEWNEP